MPCSVLFNCSFCWAGCVSARIMLAHLTVFPRVFFPSHFNVIPASFTKKSRISETNSEHKTNLETPRIT